MVDIADTRGVAYKNGSAALMARVADWEGVEIVPADIASAVYSVYTLDDTAIDTRTVVTGHNAVVLDPDDVIFSALQVDEMWTVDDEGYNFLLILDVSAAEAFVVAGLRYLVEITLHPPTGQDILLRFHISVV